jgi:hypothetical protein
MDPFSTCSKECANPYAEEDSHTEAAIKRKLEHNDYVIEHWQCPICGRSWEMFRYVRKPIEVPKNIVERKEGLKW